MLLARARRQPRALDAVDWVEGSAAARREPSGLVQLQRLQQAAGNRAVTQLLAGHVAQRQAAVEPAAPDQDDDLEAVLAEIDAALPSAPRVPAFEAVTATTAGEYSRGELERDVARLWRREKIVFSEAARRITRQGDERQGPRAAASPTVAPEQPYAHRWSVNLFAADYPRQRSDLPDVARIARAGSPFRRAIAAEFGRSFSVTNPTGRQIEQSVIGAVLELWRTLEPGAAGQIVVTFSGHGGNGSISGVDWVDVGPGQLRQLARFAADFNVHLVFVLDTCRAGVLAAYAASEAMAEAERRIEGLPEDRRRAARARAAAARQIGRALFALNSVVIAAGDAARDLRRARTDANRLAVFEAFRDVTTANRALGDVLATVDPTIGGLGPLREAQERLGWSVLGAWTGDREGITAALRASAVVLDLGQDLINAVIDSLTAETAGIGAGAGGRASTGTPRAP